MVEVKRKSALDRINALLTDFVRFVEIENASGNLDVNKYAEDIVLPIFGATYRYQELKNLNIDGRNFPGIDLGDEGARAAVQVTATNSREKITHTLKQFVEHKHYESYDHLIIYIITEKHSNGYNVKSVKDAREEAREEIFELQPDHPFVFDLKSDIRDYRDLVRDIHNLELEQIIRVVEILEANFGSPVTPLQLTDQLVAVSLSPKELIAGKKAMPVGQLYSLPQLQGIATLPILLSHLHPKAEELFETLTDAETIDAAIFRSSAGYTIAPYEVPYVSMRIGMENSGDELYFSLLDSGGSLLIEGREGSGKSREVAELAKGLISKGWTICLIRGGESDVLMNNPISFPEELKDSQVLFVIDDLHTKLDDSGDSFDYRERLNNFINYFDQKIETYIVALTHSEPKHQKVINFDPTHPLWSRFKIFKLPDIAEDALATLLVTLSRKYGLIINEAKADELVQDSDHSPRTIVTNVRQALNEGRLLDEDWQNKYQKNWSESFRRVKGRQPAAIAVYQAIYLLREAGLPSRDVYIEQLGSQLQGPLGKMSTTDDVKLAAEELANNGLVRLRGGLLDVFSDNQLKEGLETAGIALPNTFDYWNEIADLCIQLIGEKPEWSQDFQAFALRLIQVKKYEEVEHIANNALLKGEDRGIWHLYRGLSNLGLRNFEVAEAEFEASLSNGEADPSIYFLRGWIREMQGNTLGAESDYGDAIKNGFDDPAVFIFRAEILYKRGLEQLNLEEIAKAESDLSAAIDRGGYERLFSSGAINVNEIEQEVKSYWESTAETDIVDSLGITPASVVSMMKNGASLFSTRGVARLLQDNYSGADEDFNEAINRAQDFPLILLLRSIARYMQGQYSDAEIDLSAAINGGIVHAGVYDLRGFVRLLLGNLPDAGEDIHTALELEPDNPLFIFHRGYLLTRQDKHADAVVDYSEAINLGLRTSIVYYLRGNAYSFQEQLSDANADFSEAIALDENNIFAYHERGMLLYNQGDAVQAEKDYTHAIERGHVRADIYYQRGRARYDQKNYGGAESDFNVALGSSQLEGFSSQEHIRAFYWRGRARYFLGKYQEANTDFTEAIKRGVDISDVFYWRGRALLLLEQYPEAENDLTTSIENDIEDSMIYALRGVIRFRQNDFVGAEDDLTVSLDRHRNERDLPDEAVIDSYHTRGLIRILHHADYMKAKLDFSKAIEINDREATSFLWRSYANIHLGLLEEARKDCEQVEELAPNNPDTKNCWGDLHLALGKYDDAIEFYRNATKGAQDDQSDFNFSLCLALFFSGNLTEALVEYERASTIASNMDILLAIQDLDFWTEKWPERVATSEEKSTLANVRKLLTLK